MKKSTKLFTCCGLMGMLLLTSCSEDIMDASSSVPDIAQHSSFELVSAQDGPIHITAKSDADLTGKRANKAGGNDRGRFNITLRYLVDLSDRQLEVFESAAARWEEIIIQDVPSITGTIPSAFAGVPPIIDGGTIDDIVIEVVVAPIDGPGRILGQAGPRFTRSADNLTVTGIMFFDSADLASLDDRGLFENVIVHEMGHVLGIGTLWNSGGRSLRQGPDTNPYFTGKMANVHWNAEGGEDELPIENIGGPGTALGHWRESLLQNELMTGFINLGVNPLSRITAGSLRDLGYGAAIRGEQYDLPKGTPGVDISDLDGNNSDMGLYIADMEQLLEPIGVIDME